MYARVTSYQINPSRIVEMNAVLADLKRQYIALPGIKSYNTAWREDGHGMSMTIYDCRASAEEAAPALNDIWASFSNILIAKPVTELYDRTKDMLA